MTCKPPPLSHMISDGDAFTLIVIGSCLAAIIIVILL